MGVFTQKKKKKRLCVSPPSAWRSWGAAASQTISQLCSSAPLTAISGDGVMDALTHWHIVFSTSAPCWHAPWLLLIIPWTLLFLKSSQIPPPCPHISAVDAIFACLIPADGRRKKKINEGGAQSEAWSRRQTLWHHRLWHFTAVSLALYWEYVIHLNDHKSDLKLATHWDAAGCNGRSVTCWFSLASALWVAKWATAYD